jgi:8-oxo-dGTP pyrophosphatase MutT (NUDIX family)
MDEHVLESRRIFDGHVVNLRVDRVEMADGATATREVVEHSPAVAIVPVTAGGQILLVRQYRLPAGRELLEVPAGSLDPGEDPDTAAQRELQEETGFAAGRLHRLGGFWVAPGYCTEYIHVFLAEDLHESRLAADHDERIELESLTLDDALAGIDRGEIDDAKSICGLLLYARSTAR